MEVTFKLETFEGPLDLLLHLIQKNKVSITDIPISIITRQYLEYIDQMKQLDMEVTGEFLVIAAQLLYIKSRMLLPRNEEEEDEGDPRAELVDRLLEYAKYREAVSFLDPRQNSARYLFFKKPDDIPLPRVRYIETSISLSKLTDAFLNVLERSEKKTPIRRESLNTIVARETVPVSFRIKYIFSLFKHKSVMRFEEFFIDSKSKAEAVSTFLAVLELIRRGNMTIESDDNECLYCRLSGDENEFDRVDSDY